MLVRFVDTDLRRLDDLRSEALCAGLFEDETPPRGVLGLVDWRLAGRLSRYIAAGRLRGEAGRVYLLPTGKAFPFDKLFVLGLGAASDPGAQAVEHTTEVLIRILSLAGVRSAAMAFPTWSGEGVTAAGGRLPMERFAELLLARGELDELTVLERIEAHRALEDAFARARRRLGADEPIGGRHATLRGG